MFSFLSRLVIASSVSLAAVLAGELARAEDAVLVSVTGPLVGRVGDRVSFEVELVNRSGQPLQQLRVIDYFDAGFHHEASTSPIEQRGTIDLAPGTARRLTLDFLLDEPGRQCHRVVILDQSQRNLGGAQHCVEVAPNPAFTPPPAAPPSTVNVPPPASPAVTTPPPLVTPPASSTVPVAAEGAAAIELDLTGPIEVLAGDVVRYVAIIKNNGTAPSKPARLEFSWDDNLSPLEASDGYDLAGTKVSWTIPAIKPKAAQERQVNLRAELPAGTFSDSPPTRACVRAVLSGLAGGSMLADDACVGISSTTPRPRLRSPSEAGLRLSIADLDDPVRSGDATTLVCTISNGSTAESGRLELVVLLPEGAQMVGDPIPARVRVENSRVNFGSVSSIPPGGRQTFEITYRLPFAGTGKASAIVTSGELEGSLERTCQTTFLAD
ncbi:MAG: hypothetical protein O3C39_00850 [Planctomycetota bacterium]|jgi:hypothetical protein|nr:hypothetical protein [Planctomycetota bacterium]MDA1200208.1 hypothetical protein [Planctomycetota bacterium]